MRKLVTYLFDFCSFLTFLGFLDQNASLEEVDSAAISSLRSSIVSQLSSKQKQEKKVQKKVSILSFLLYILFKCFLSYQPERDVTLHLSVTETDFLVVEDLRNSASNAVVLKGTLVLTLKSPPKTRGKLNCTVELMASQDLPMTYRHKL